MFSFLIRGHHLFVRIAMIVRYAPRNSYLPSSPAAAVPVVNTFATHPPEELLAGRVGENENNYAITVRLENCNVTATGNSLFYVIESHLL